MKHSVRLMPESDLEAASQTLARAFMDEPIQMYVLPDAAERMIRSPAHFAAILRHGLMFGEVYTSENAEGVAIWLRPGETEITPGKAVHSGLDKLPQILGNEAAERFSSVFGFLAPYHKKDAAEPHWYTWVVGVDPIFQRSGLGKALMEPVMDRAGLNKTPVYLETAKSATVLSLTKYGFRVVRDLTDPHSKLRLWTLKKDW